MSVASLGYLGFESNKLAEWRKYAVEFLGLMDVSLSDEALRFKMDEHSWRLAVQEGPAEDLVYVGFDVFDSENFDAMIQHLSEYGCEVNEDIELAKQRNVRRLCRLEDPDGLQIELYVGKLVRAEQRFVSAAGIKAFITADQGLGHIVLFTKDLAKKYAFYTELLGFELSDSILLGGKLDLKFLHCNQRHHTVALVQAPLDKTLNHFMLQVTEFDDVGFALDRAEAADIKVTSGLGCHTNDRMVSFYAATPSGFDVEFGFGARTIGPEWSVEYHESTSIWGHKKRSER